MLIKADPPDSSRGFNDKTITFTFDEYIDQQLATQENLLISPMPAITPEITAKLKTVTIKIKDTLEPNTTYYYQMGRMIKDVNEGNVLQNFSYIFSTGNIIDSLELGGRVILAETGGIDSTLIVMLHKNGEDSAVAKERPRFITKLDGKGNFHFHYLPEGIYHIYALKDEFGSRRYRDSTQLFAFADSPVVIKPDAAAIILYAGAAKKAQGSSQQTISFTGNRNTRGEDRRLRFSTSLNNNTQDLLSPFSLNFEQPLRVLDSSKIQLSTDSAFNKEPAYIWEIDSLNKKLTLKINWKENTLYNLILDKEFAEDTSGKKLLKTDTLRFTTRKKTDYGSLKVVFNNLDLSKNPVLQLTQGGQAVKSIPLTSAVYFQPLFQPGEFELRLLFDANKNGVWDPGEFFSKRRQPELVKPLDKKITVRANWENEIEITL
jgi:hypothetical protein